MGVSHLSIFNKIFNRGLIPIILTAGAALGLFSCTVGQDTSSLVEGLQTQDLFSNRPSRPANYMAVVKLKEPALLSDVLISSEGIPIVRDGILMRLTTEQQAFTRQLTEVAPNTRIVHQYKYVFNGFALFGPYSELQEIEALATVAKLEMDGFFHRPETRAKEAMPVVTDLFDFDHSPFSAREGAQSRQESRLAQKNSVEFIGAFALHQRGITGRGVKVAVIDSGIDFTHAMLGGSGDRKDAEQMNPAVASPLFPNAKVVGGFDFVGEKYNPSERNPEFKLPQPDPNPFDADNHGTHVAGSIAGIGDGLASYSGVAPEAQLYAFKVFSSAGGTSDTAVIAALEASVDPYGRGGTQLRDRIHVLNLSLGGPFGNSKALYGEAIRSLKNSGTIIVASAGNSGSIDYITGAPAAVDGALSVGASVDHTEHLWKRPAIRVVGWEPDQIFEATEAAFTVTVDQTGELSGVVVFAGLGRPQDFDGVEVTDKVVLLNRGEISFEDKVRTAVEKGAKFVIIANTDDELISMASSGGPQIQSPALAVSKSTGQWIRDQLAQNADLQLMIGPGINLSRPDLIDTMASFSSKGPRFGDSAIKPEIVGPGVEITSAQAKSGTGVVRMSGTSMSGPHLAGAMALMRQAFPQASVEEIFTRVLNQAKPIKDKNNDQGVLYPVSLQGAGRVQLDRVVDARVLASVKDLNGQLTRATLSLGQVDVVEARNISRTLELRNLTDETLRLQLEFKARTPGIRLARELTNIEVPARASQDIRVSFSVSMGPEGSSPEKDGWLEVKQYGRVLASLPVLAVVVKTTHLTAKDLIVESSEADAPGSVARVTLENSGATVGDAYLFNLIAEDSRKTNQSGAVDPSYSCDLQSVGYRIIDRNFQGVGNRRLVQFAIKMHAPLTRWTFCEPSILIDADGDGLAEQELAGVTHLHIDGMAHPFAGLEAALGMSSALFDARVLRRVADTELTIESPEYLGFMGGFGGATGLLDTLPIVPFNFSTVMIVEADLSKIERSPANFIRIRVASQEYWALSAQPDDFLGDSASNWLRVPLEVEAQSFFNMPQKVTVPAGTPASPARVTVEFEKGHGATPLMVLFPENSRSSLRSTEDRQQVLLRPRFETPRMGRR